MSTPNFCDRCGSLLPRGWRRYLCEDCTRAAEQTARPNPDQLSWLELSEVLGPERDTETLEESRRRMI